MIGQTISHYRVLEKLGQGGMGEVYLAEDSSLDRKVALKFLSEELQRDETARQRFVREAKSAAALDHPFICKVYEAGEFEGRDFIAMEYVAGRTLEQKLQAGPLPLRQALVLATEIAEALEKAHREGIVHRDLKPSNILLTDEGHAKVMDFGLAKRVVAGKDPERDITTALTREGTTLGTLAYISPEQLRGRAADSRSDIFSFGVLLYEMVTGKHPFRTGTQAETIHGLLSQEPPPVSHHREGVSDLLDHTVGKMLAKDPEDRYQSVHEIRSNLKRLLDRRGPSEVVPGKAGAGRTTWRRTVFATLGLIAIALVLALFYWSPWTTAPELPPPETSPLTFFPGVEHDPEFSPNGQYVAFSWKGVALDNLDVYVQLLGDDEPTRLTTDPSADFFPTWSGDNSRIAFVRSTSSERFNKTNEYGVYVTPVLRSSEEKVTDSTFKAGPFNGGLSWSPSEEVLATVDRSGPDEPESIFLVSLQTREKHQLTFPPPGAWDAWPRFSPDGRTVAFVRVALDSGFYVWLQDTDGTKARCLLSEEALFVRGLDWTADGAALVVILSRMASQDAHLVKVPLDGGEPERLRFGENADWVSVARSGGKLVYTKYASNMDLWRAGGPKATEVFPPVKFAASSMRNEMWPAYSPDGDKVAFITDRRGTQQIWRSDAEGRHLLRLTDRFEPYTNQWSPGSDRIAFAQFDPEEGTQGIAVIDGAGGPPRNLTPDEFVDNCPSWSADGRWIYYSSQRDGTVQIFRIPAEGGTPEQLTEDGGNWPHATEDGRVLFWRDEKIWIIPPEGGGEGLALEKHIEDAFWCAWKDNIVYSDPDGAGFSLEMFNLTSGDTILLHSIPVGNPGAGITVSPDGQWILFVQYFPTGDIMLVENFR